MPVPMVQLTPELQAAVTPLTQPVAPPPIIAAQSQNPAPQNSQPAPTANSPDQSAVATNPAPSPAVITPPASAPASAKSVPAVAPVTPFGQKLHASLLRSLPALALATLGKVGNAATDILAPISAPETSPLYYAAKTAQNIQAQRQSTLDAAAKQKQQDFENQMKSNEDQRAQQALNSELQMNQAKMAEAHANQINAMRIASDESDEFDAKMQASADTLAQPYLDSGGEILAHDIPESQKLDWMKNEAPKDPQTGKPDLTQYISFQDGKVPIMDSKTGKQLVDADGDPQFQRTYQIIKIGPDVELTKDQATILNKYAPPNQGTWEVGQKLSGINYALLAKRAQAAETVALNVEKTQSEISKNDADAKKAIADANSANQTAAQKAQNLATEKLFAPYLGIAGGDPVIALDYMKRSKDAKSVAAVEQMYGPGVLDKTRAQNLTTLTKTIDDDEKQLNDPTISATMSDDDKTQLQNELKAARAQRNEYLGLHPSDPPQMTQTIMQFDKVDPAKRSATILATSMPNSAKIYVLRHYGLPVPPALLPQANAQPAAQR